MKARILFWQVMCVTSFTISQAHSQATSNNVAVVNRIYEALENNNTPTLIAQWVPDMKWYKSTNTFNSNEPYDSYNEILNEICDFFQNQWENLTFSKMNIQEIEQDVVLVTGTITGRKNKETKVTSSEIHHLWWLKDGKVVKFLE